MMDGGTRDKRDEKVLADDGTADDATSGEASARGFAALRPEQRRLISSRGGRAAHQKGSAHQFTSEEARAAGRKGGQASARARARKKRDD